MTSNEEILEKTREFFPELVEEKEKEALMLLKSNDIVGFCALFDFPKICFSKLKRKNQTETAFKFYEEVLVKEIIARNPIYNSFA